MPKQELLGEVKKLITIGKEKGFLTYDELNNTLPAEVVSSDQFGSIMAMFGRWTSKSSRRLMGNGCKSDRMAKSAKTQKRSSLTPRMTTKKRLI